PAAVSVELSASTRASISRAAASAAGVTTATFAPSGGRNTASTPSPKNLRISPPAAHRIAEAVEDAVKAPGYFLGRCLLGEVGKAAHVGTGNGSSDPADGAALHLPGTDPLGRIAAEIGREQVVRHGRCDIAFDRQRQRPRQFLDRRQFQGTPAITASDGRGRGPR